MPLIRKNSVAYFNEDAKPLGHTFVLIVEATWIGGKLYYKKCILNRWWRKLGSLGHGSGCLEKKKMRWSYIFLEIQVLVEYNGEKL